MKRITVSLMPPLLPPLPSPVLWTDPCDELRSDRWREIEVRGRTQYEMVTLDGRRCLKAWSHAGASILLTTAHFDPKTYPWLSWHWRVDQLVAKEALERREGSDAAARIYVYFETSGLPWQRRSLDYVLRIGREPAMSQHDDSAEILLQRNLW